MARIITVCVTDLVLFYLVGCGTSELKGMTDAREEDEDVVCGNGIIEIGEECDDGNSDMWDGCFQCVIVERRIEIGAIRQNNNPSVGINQFDRFVIVWEGEDEDGNTIIYGQQLAVDGVEEEIIQISTPELEYNANPDVAVGAGGDFLIAWQASRVGEYGVDVFVRKYSSDSLPESDPIKIPSSLHFPKRENPSISAAMDGYYILAWRGTARDEAGDHVIQASQLDMLGIPIGDIINISDGPGVYQRSPNVFSSQDGSFIVTWAQDPAEIVVNIYHPDGSPMGPNILVSSSGNYPITAMNGHREILVVWSQSIDTSNIMGRLFDSSGGALYPETRINTLYMPYIGYPSASMALDGRYAVVWDNCDPPLSEPSIFLRHYYDAGIASAPEHRINSHPFTTDADSPSLAMTHDGKFVVAWEAENMIEDTRGIYFKMFNENGEEM